MMSPSCIIPVLALSVVVLIRAEFQHKRKIVYIAKPLSTLLVIAIAMLSFGLPTHEWTFSVLIIFGLLFCFGGDVALMFQKSAKAFRVGLVFFLIGHIVYSTVFVMFGVFSMWDILAVGLLLAAGIGFYRLIRPNLGAMKVPVILYMLIISIMVDLAVGMLANPAVGKTQGLLVFFGAVLFYLSDVILAANRFWKPWRYHRISLALYYAGQLLIALSAGYFVQPSFSTHF